MKIVINRCYGGFGLSDAAYAKLIKWGVPVRAYKEQERDPVTKLYLPCADNDGEVIFDRTLSADRNRISFLGRYWETWLRNSRSHPLLVRVVKQLGKDANGPFAKLKIVEIPDDVKWEIAEYDGAEHVAEVHRTWYE